MCKSEILIEKLIAAGIQIRLCDRVKAKDIIKQYLAELHNESVQSTIMASNKLKFVMPPFSDNN